MLSLRLAFRNLFRNARRTVLTVLLIGFSLAAMILADGAIIGMTRLMVDSVTETIGGDMQIQRTGYLESFEPSLLLDDAAGLLEAARADEAVVAATPRVITGAMVSSPYNMTGAQVFGIDHTSEPDVSRADEAVIKGKYLTGERGEILIGDELATLLEAELGDRLVVTLAEARSGELAQALFRVSGIIEFGMRELDSTMAFINLDQARDILGLDGEAHQIVVQLADRERAVAAIPPLRRLASEDIEVTSWLEANADIASMIAMTEYSSGIVGLILFFLASLGVINSMFMSIFERIYEIGVIKAVGTKPWQIVLLVQAEAGLIALISCGLGLAFGLALGWWFSIEGIPMGELEVSGINASTIKTVILERHYIQFPLYVIALILVAALYPARFASRIVPAHALKRSL